MPTAAQRPADGHRLDPWPELPDDDPLWIPVRPDEDARHLRELAAEQRGE